MTDLVAFLDTPIADDPVAAVLTFAAGTMIGLGATMLISHAMKEDMRCRERRECER